MREYKKRGRPCINGRHIVIDGEILKVGINKKYGTHGGSIEFMVKGVDAPIFARSKDARNLILQQINDDIFREGINIKFIKPVWVKKGKMEFVMITNNNLDFELKVPKL